MDYFYLGKKFSSYDEVQAVLQQMKEKEQIEFRIRSCRTFNVKRSKKERYVNKALNYQNIKFVCSRGGRRYLPRKGVRNRMSLKVGCEAFVYLNLSKCGQYLQVNKICLDHNHVIEPRPPSKMEKRAERRRQRLMERMKVSYEEAVILERMKVSAKHSLVGPLEEDSLFEQQSSESSNNLETELPSNSSLKRTVCITDKHMDKLSGSKEQNDDEDTRLSVDLNYNSNNDSDQDSDVTLQQMISSAKKTKRTKEMENDEHYISDDEDYRRPLVIHKNLSKKDDSLPKNDGDDLFVQKINIFTRKGDDGMASTFSGVRRYKDDEVFEALGTIEELSSSIGYAKELLPVFCSDVTSELIEIQCVLQDMVIHVGTPRSSCTEFHIVNSQFPEIHVKHLEDLITRHEARLPSVNAIILPSGGPCSCALHVARGVCRRAERRVACLVRQRDIDRTIMCYLNRLGDYLFVAARIVSFISGKHECIYRQPSYNVSPSTSASTKINQNYSVIYIQQPNQ